MQNMNMYKYRLVHQLWSSQRTHQQFHTVCIYLLVIYTLFLQQKLFTVLYPKNSFEFPRRWAQKVTFPPHIACLLWLAHSKWQTYLYIQRSARKLSFFYRVDFRREELFLQNLKALALLYLELIRSESETLTLYLHLFSIQTLFQMADSGLK